jgi:hypothetical protein
VNDGTQWSPTKTVLVESATRVPLCVRGQDLSVTPTAASTFVDAGAALGRCEVPDPWVTQLSRWLRRLFN